jgi:hypothetical protein
MYVYRWCECGVNIYFVNITLYLSVSAPLIFLFWMWVQTLSSHLQKFHNLYAKTTGIINLFINLFKFSGSKEIGI